jgi:large subunit ribosomal protein L24
MKMHVKRNDIVKVLAGKDRGKQGKVIRVLPQRERVIVEGVNLAKRHVKARARNQKGGIVDKEMPIHISNVMKVTASE